MCSIDQVLAHLNEHMKRLDKEIGAVKKRHEEELAPLLANRAKLETSLTTIQQTVDSIVCHRCGGSGTGIDGAGYNFYEAHWLPLYNARGLQWHDTETEKSKEEEQ